MRGSHALFLLLVLLRCDGGWKSTATLTLRRCTAEKHKFFDKDEGRCKRCQKCPQGWGLMYDSLDIQKQRGSRLPLTCYKCSPCIDGHYSEHRDYGACKRCLSCTLLGRLEIRVCDATLNTRCGACKPGYHDIYKKLTKVENSRRPCQECQHADHEVPDCQTDYVLSTTASARKSTISVLIPDFPLWRRINSTTASETPQTQVNSPNWFSMILDIHNTTQQVDPDNVQDQYTGENATPQFYAVGVLISVALCVVIWYVVRHKDSSPTIVPVPSHLNDLQKTSYLENEHRKGLLAKSLNPDVESDGCLEGTAPLISRRQRSGQLPAVHYNKNMYTTQTLIHSPDQKLSWSQKTVLWGLGINWQDLGRALGATDASMECLREDYPRNRKEQIYQMIIGLERSNPEQVTVGNVYKALQSINQPQLSREFLETIKTDEVRLNLA